MKRICPCGMQIEVFLSRVKDKKGKYCSKKCMYLYRKRPKGLSYLKHKINPTSFKKGEIPWNAGTAKPYFDKSIGYYRIRIHGYKIKYHRYIMQKYLGRELFPEEIVHHKDHNKLNNDIHNLEIMTRSEHMRHHRSYKNI